MKSTSTTAERSASARDSSQQHSVCQRHSWTGSYFIFKMAKASTLRNIDAALALANASIPFDDLSAWRSTHLNKTCKDHSADAPDAPVYVAHCIAGLARTFAHPSLMLPQLVKRNMIDAFGGKPSLFLYLKTFQTAPKDSSFRFPAKANEDLHEDGSDEQKRGLDALIAYLQPTMVLLMANESHAVNPHCHVGPTPYVYSKLYSTQAGVLRHVGQMASSLACLKMIEQHELRFGTQFDFVVRSRPDVAVLAPIPSRCHFDDAYMLYMVQAFNQDWLYVSSRKVANVSLAMLHAYERCKGTLAWGGHYETGLQIVVQKAGMRVGRVRMALALTTATTHDQRPCTADKCSLMPGYRGHSPQFGCCVGGLRLQCHYQNHACSLAMRSYQSMLHL